MPSTGQSVAQGIATATINATPACTLREEISDPTGHTGWAYSTIVFSFITTVKKDLLTEVTGDIKSALDGAMFQATIDGVDCNTIFSTEFNKNVAVYAAVEQEKARQIALNGYTTLEERLMRPGMTGDEKNRLIAMKDTPRKMCEEAKTITKNDKKAQEHSLRFFKAYLDQIKIAIGHKDSELTPQYIEEKASKTYVFSEAQKQKANRAVAEYVVEFCAGKTGAALRTCLQTRKTDLETAIQVTQGNQKGATTALSEFPKCDVFPEKVSGENICENAGIITKGKALFASLKEVKVQKCIGLTAVATALSTIMATLVKEFAKAAIQVLINLLGGFVFTAVIIVYYLIKMFFQFYKVKKYAAKPPAEANKKEKSAALGKALGYLFKVIKHTLSLFGVPLPVGRRLQRKLAKRNRRRRHRKLF